MTDIGWQNDVLTFWFEELTPKDWFTQNSVTDEMVRDRFLALHQRLAGEAPLPRAATADDALAAIILFDQLPRNMFRGKAEAFATDPLALAIARDAVARSLDSVLPESRKQFLYMPFMHSEKIADQEQCVALFSAPGDGAKYAIEHRDIIAAFGRFPHRNRALGRQNTQEELDFLSGHAGFGQ